MKVKRNIKLFGKQPRLFFKEPKPAPAHDGSYIDSKTQFLNLRPLDKKALAESMMVVPRSQRPYLCRTAKAEGIEYMSRAVGNDMILVMRIAPLDQLVKH